MTDAPIFIPDNCYRVTMFREYRVSGVILFFRLDLTTNAHVDTSFPLKTSEQAEAIKALFDDWALIKSDDRHQVYERNTPR